MTLAEDDADTDTDTATTIAEEAQEKDDH